MTRFRNSVLGDIAGRIALVFLSAVIVGSGHYLFTAEDLVVSLQFAGAAAWGAVIMDTGKDLMGHFYRRE